MDNEELVKCESKENRYATNICVHLRGYLQFHAKKGMKGFFVGSSVMISTGEKLGEKVTYQDGKKPPVLLNFCPFCGGELHSIGDE